MPVEVANFFENVGRQVGRGAKGLSNELLLSRSYVGRLPKNDGDDDDAHIPL